ncbi:MAG: hypothetical protein QOD75_2771 [Blastocatellia bacterium]|jgi:hypothetical protein|nr:hypothetical protein [Blastocatellia bacterium]
MRNPFTSALVMSFIAFSLVYALPHEQAFRRDVTSVHAIEEDLPNPFSVTGYAELFTLQRPQNPGGQVGTYCAALPRCPDCVNGGNVCRGAEQFYPGLTYFLGGKKDIIRRCQQANALDYCGGSYGCVRQKNWTPRDADRYMQRYGGGCYKQCEKVAACAFQGRP